MRREARRDVTLGGVLTNDDKLWKIADFCKNFHRRVMDFHLQALSQVIFQVIFCSYCMRFSKQCLQSVVNSAILHFVFILKVDTQINREEGRKSRNSSYFSGAEYTGTAGQSHNCESIPDGADIPCILLYPLDRYSGSNTIHINRCGQ